MEWEVAHPGKGGPEETYLVDSYGPYSGLVEELLVVPVRVIVF